MYVILKHSVRLCPVLADISYPTQPTVCPVLDFFILFPGSLKNSNSRQKEAQPPASSGLSIICYKSLPYF